MRPNGSAVNHLDFTIMGSADGRHQPSYTPAFRQREKRL